MKGRKQRFFVEDILESIKKIERYIENMSYKDFEKNELIVDAVIRNIEIIGEASRNIPDDIRDKYTDIPWKRMIGLRNIATHEYFGIDVSIIWEIITVNLPETKPKIESVLKDFN
jgi:uncharacterized protein with HEPN domain